MSKYDRPIKLSAEEGGERALAPGDADETNPRGLKFALSIRCNDSGKNKSKPVIFSVICLLQQKSASFSASLNADDLSRIALSVPSMAS
jgi:hypothetical protein